MPIPEQDALRAIAVAKANPNDPAVIAKAQALTRAYQAQQEAAGLSMFPEQERRRDEQASTLRSFFTEPNHGLDEDTLVSLNENFRESPDEKFKLFNRKWFEAAGVPRERVEREADELMKIYSEREWGTPSTTHKHFFDRIARDYQTREEVANAAKETSLQNLGVLRSELAFKERFRENSSYVGREQKWDKEFQSLKDRFDQKLAPHRSTVKLLSAALMTKEGVDVEDPTTMDEALAQRREIDNAASYRELAEMVMMVPAEDRKLVIAAAVAASANDEAGRKSVMEGLVEKFDRGLRGGMDSVVSIGERSQAIAVERAIAEGVEVPAEKAGTPEEYMEAVLQRVAGGDAYEVRAGVMKAVAGADFDKPSDEVKDQALAMIRENKDAIDLRDELRLAAENDIDPVTSEFLPVRGLYAAAESVPYMMTSMARGGWAINAMALAGDSYRSLRAANPTMTAEQAQTLSMLSGPFQAFIEKGQTTLALGQFKAVNRFFNQITRTKGAVASRFLTRTAATAGLEMVQENVQDLTPFVLQGLLSALDEDMPEVPWGPVYGDLLKQQPELFFAVLPLAVIGGGAGTYSDFKGGAELLTSYDLLRATGLSEAAASEVRALASQGNVEGAQTLLRQEFKTLGQDQKSVQEARAEAIPRMIAEREAMQQALNEAGELDILPAILREGEKYTLRYSGGEAVQYDSHAEAFARFEAVASSAVAALHEDMITAARMTTSQIERGREVKFIVSPLRPTTEDMEAQGVATGEDMAQRMEISEADKALTPKTEERKAKAMAGMVANSPEARTAVNYILGSATTSEAAPDSFGDRVVRNTVRLYQGATPFTLFEETAEGDAKFMIRELGLRRWMIGALRQWEATSGDTLFRASIKEESQIKDQDIVEAYSKMVQGYLAGRSKSGDQGRVFSSRFRKSIADALRGDFGAVLTGYASLFEAVYRRAAMIEKARRDKTFDGDLETFLAKSIGVTEQGQFERTVIKEGEGIAKDMGVEFLDEQTFSTMSPVPVERIQALMQRIDSMYEAGQTEGVADLEAELEILLERAESDLDGMDEGDDSEQTFLPYKGAPVISRDEEEDPTFPESELVTLWYEWTGKIRSSRGMVDELRETYGTFGAYAKNHTGGEYGSWAIQEGITDEQIEDAAKEAAEIYERRRTAMLRSRVENVTFSTMRLSEQDRRYLELAKDPEANREELQRMVDEAAKPSSGLAREVFSTLMWGNNEIVDPDDFLNGRSVQKVIENGGDIWDYQNRFGGAHPWMPADLSDFQRKELADWLWDTNGILAEINTLDDVSIPPGYPDNESSREMRRGVVAYAKWHQSADPVTYDESGNVIPLSQRFDQTRDEITFSTLRFDEIAKEDPKNDGSRVGTAWQGKVKPTTQDTNDGISTVSPKELEKQMAMVTHFVDEVPLPKFITKFRNPEKRMRAFIDFQKKNLLALYDAFNDLSADYVIRSTHWYDGARLLAEGIRDNFSVTVEQASSIIAVFSPMKDWFQNVAMGQRFADVMANHRNTTILESEMGGAMQTMLNAAENPDAIRVAFAAIEGNSITQLLEDRSPEGRKTASVAVRLMSTHVHGLDHDVLSPEGESMGTRKNLDGSNKTLVWQSYAFIEKAISIFEDGSLENISRVLGTEHKIRNFYNNIVSPTSPYGDATVDTHAVNAAVLYPMGNKGYLVGLNFGGAGVAGGGNSGLYWLFHEALREAAAERGVMPRQMQSITWEAIRGLFTDIRKRDKNFIAQITKIWQTASDADSARSQIIGLGITPPEWARVASGDSRLEGGMGGTSGQGTDAAGSVRSGVRQDGSRGDRGAGGSFSVVRTTGDIDTRFASMFSPFVRSPELRPKLGEMARERGAKVLREVLPYILQSKRSIASIDREARSIEAFEYDRLLRETFNANSPEEQEALPPVDRQAARSEAQSLAEKWKAQKVREKKKAPKEVMIGHLRTLDAILRALPAEVRGKIGGFVAIAKLTDPDAMLDEIEARVKKIDIEVEKWLRKEAETRRKKLFKQAEPVRDAAGKKPKGKAGADIHDLFDRLKEALLWDGDQAEAWATMLEDRIGKGELSAEAEAHAKIEANLVRLFSDWKNADAARRTAAVDAGEEVWRVGYLAEKERIAQERERRAEVRAEIIAGTGKLGSRPERVVKAQQDAGLSGQWKEWFLSLFNFEQVAGFAMGAESKWTLWFSDAQREAEAKKLDEVQAVLDGLDELFRELGGSRLGGEKLQWKLSQPSFETKAGGKMSELEGVTALLMWRQEDGKRHMRGKRDENGKIVSAWSYDETFIAEIEKNLSTEALAVMDYLTDQYAGEYETLNPIFRELNGINLPRNDKYSPLTVKPQQAPGGQTTDPVTGSTMSNGSMTPGSLRTRAQVVAEPDFRNAVEVFVGHKKQLAHWKAYAVFSRDAQAILGNREVGNAIEAASGQEAAKVLRSWLDLFAQGGVRDAGSHLALTKALGAAMGRASAVQLVGRLGTLAIQTTQLGAAAAKMPVRDYIVRLSKLLTGNLGWGEALNSPYIQRRLAQMPASVQVAMEGLRAGKPNMIKHAAQRVGRLLSGTDALFTAGTYAMVFDYQLTKATKAGVDPVTAAEIARNEAERIVDEIAQPTRQGTRSLFEATATNPLGRVAWAFASEARKNMALVAYTGGKRPSGDLARALLYVIVFNGVLSALIRTAWRDLRDDEEGEDEWGMRRILLSVASEPLYGFPGFGEIAQDAIFAAAGEWKPSGSILDAPVKAPAAIVRAPENFGMVLEGDFEQPLRDLETMLMAGGLFNDTVAGLASFSHVLRDAESLIRNFIPNTP